MCGKMRDSTLLSGDIIPLLLCLYATHSTDLIIRHNNSSKLQVSPFSIRDNHDCSIKVLNSNSFIQSGCQAPQRRKSWHLAASGNWISVSESQDSLNQSVSQSDVKRYTQTRFITPPQLTHCLHFISDTNKCPTTVERTRKPWRRVWVEFVSRRPSFVR